MKMSLKNVQKGRQHAPWNILLYGDEGTGKSSFASEAPNPIFFDIEEGTKRLDVERMPLAETWPELQSGLLVLLKEPHDYKTVVVDTADAAERLIHDAVCGKKGASNIEDLGYGKGYEYALDYWAQLTTRLKELREHRGMNTIILAHSQIKKFSNPRGEDYDRYQLKLAPKADGFLRDRVEAVLFATYDEGVREKDRGRNKAFGDGSRVVYTERRPGWHAKNRYGLPFEMSLNWAEFEAAATSGTPATLDEFRDELMGILPDLSKAHQAKVRASLERVGEDTLKLRMLVDWARSKIVRKTEVAA